MRRFSITALVLCAAPAWASEPTLFHCTYSQFCENDTCQAMEIVYDIAVDTDAGTAIIAAFGRETAADVALGSRSITLTWSSPLGGEMVTFDIQAFRAVHTNHMATDWAIDVQRMTGECRPTGQE